MCYVDFGARKKKNAFTLNCTTYSDSGIKIKLSCITAEPCKQAELSKANILYSSIVFEVNIGKLIGKGKLYLYSEQDKKLFLCSLRDVLLQIKQDNNVLIPSWQNLKINRIDYTVDLHTNNGKRYLELLQKCRYNTRLKERKKYQTSIYLTNNSYRINIYDKTAERQQKRQEQQIQHQKDKRYRVRVTPDEIEQVKNVLRIEFQLTKNKLNSFLCEKYGCSYYLSNTDLLNDNISYYVITTLLQQNFKDGQYYTLDCLKTLLQRNFSQKKADKIYNLLAEINTKGQNIRTVIADSKRIADLTPATARAYLNEVNRLTDKKGYNISVAPLPRPRTGQTEKVRTLPSIITLINDEYFNKTTS